MKIVIISDTHNKHNKITIPECDILVHCGDWTFQGEYSEVKNFAKWLNKQPAKHIVVIPGNHEKYFEKRLKDTPISSVDQFKDECSRAHLLIHESVEIEGLKFFGSPWTPWFCDWAWNAGRTVVEAAHKHKPFIGDLWKDIPEDTNFLITHGPPYGILDDAEDYNTGRIIPVGCMELLKKVETLKHLKVHAFGHIHLFGGKTFHKNGVIFANASVCNEKYLPENNLIILEI